VSFGLRLSAIYILARLREATAFFMVLVTAVKTVSSDANNLDPLALRSVVNEYFKVRATQIFLGKFYLINS